MKNLRITSVVVNSSTSVTVNFTEKLNPEITVDNFSIKSQTLNIPDSQILKVSVLNAAVTIECLPLTPYAAYYVTATSNINSTIPYDLVQSINGDAILLEDGVANRQLVLGPAEPDNVVRDFFKNFLKDNIYNIDDPTTVVSKVVEAFVNNLSKALNDVRQTKNENYLKFEVIDEEKTRGQGPYDRLNEESAYEVTRVAQRKTGEGIFSNVNITNFPFYPVTLQAANNSESLTISSENIVKKFNINELILNLSSTPVTKLKKVVFNLNVSPITYTYDIEKYGYQIKNNTYDQDYGFSYAVLEDNQIKLNSQILNIIDFNLESIVSVYVEYEYKDTGKIIYSDTLVLSKILVSSRETLPPIINIFDLKHAPIVNSSGEVASLGGVTFINTNTLSSSHPAFLYEIPFRFEALPSIPGQYSIDYNNGRVYVFGEDSRNTGTGPTPPVATYSYKYIYQNETDYVFDSDTKDLVSLPYGNLRTNSVNINFKYEKVLVPDVDYVAQVHKEILSERIENRLLNLGTLKVTNSPVTNVFRIYNETSGELYSVNRWNQDKVYFNYNIAPKLQNQIFERVSFENVNNELLTQNNYYTNFYSLKVLEIYLSNNNIIAATEDCVGSSINTSVYFTNTEIFAKEKFYERYLTPEDNYNKLSQIGEYCIDYVNGVVYCAVSMSQGAELGFISYKKDNIITDNKHIISVNDIYYQINPLNPKNKVFGYLSFGDNNVVPKDLQFSDEQYLNDNTQYVYQIYNQEVGVFDGYNFNATVGEQIKFVRGVFEYNDLLNSTNPINFAPFSSNSNSAINVGANTGSIFTEVLFDGTNFYVNLPQNIPYVSNNINFDINIIRKTDNNQLWNNSGVIVPGNPVKLILPGINTPSAGDKVTLSYDISINNFSRVIVDYNKGDLYIDYTYLADEIIISYEYGDNVIDFRKSLSIATNDTYYVSYKVGALRDALLKNFGALLTIDELNAFNINLDRERYRDALMAAMASAVQGPTAVAIKNLVAKITHIQPEIIESVFQSWSLGNSLLYPNGIKTTGNFDLLPAKFNNGVLIDESNQSIFFPASSNLSLTQGTFETWVAPRWNGIDNEANLKIKVLKNNQSISSNLIFIGQSEYHPNFDGYQEDGYYFNLNKNESVTGIPQKNKNGVFIYYAPDTSELFDRWYINIIDDNATGSEYIVKIESDGVFYDSKSLSGSSNIVFTTKNKALNIKYNNFTYLEETVTFISDKERYLLDVGGEEEDKNRLSLYKDASGYLNFKVYDKFKTSYSVSADISNWRAGDLHFIGISWKLNTDNNRDEMHLFIDGFEVPNIIKYGQKLLPYPHEKFRTIDPETLIGLSGKDIVGSTDLSVIAGSPLVSSLINFSAYNISVGDKIYIDDPSFDVNGYSIILINGQELTLASSMPITANNLKYSVNQTSYTLQTEAAIFPNIAVSTLSVVAQENDLNTTVNSNVVNSNLLNYSLVKVGYLIRILNSNFDLTYNILGIDATAKTLNLDYDMPVSLSGLSFYIYSNEETEIPGVRALNPSYEITTDGYYNSILTVYKDVLENDLILLKTLGLNHRKCKYSYYCWSNQVENVIPTTLPPPISLDDVKITRVIYPNTVINLNNSTVVSGVLTSNLNCYQPSNSQTGRSITGIISGTNVDFSTPVTLSITGINDNFVLTTETITFSDYGRVNFNNRFITISSSAIICKPININRDCLAIKLEETYPLTYAENSGLAPVIRYSYQMAGGTNLSGDGYVVNDGYNFFSYLDKDNILIIRSPISAAGYYKITDVNSDHQSMTIEETIASNSMPLPSFIDGVYKVVNITDYRTGLQNGFFILQQDVLVSQPYLLKQGYYDFEYYTYLSAKFDPLSNQNVYIGSDIDGRRQFNGLIDSIKIYSIMLTDTRVNEVIPSNQRSVTKDFNSLIPFKSDINTLALITFDTYPFINSSDYYKKFNGGSIIQSNVSINENFNNSVLITQNPIVLDNDGILDSKKQATIEFWVNPLFDSANDPNERYYFDAYNAKVVNVTSYNNSTVKLSEVAETILSVTLKNGDPEVDYFAGGRLELDNLNVVVEESNSTSNTVVTVANRVFQVISVIIDGDFSKKDYFAGGTIAPDGVTIYLGSSLPDSNLPLIVTYKPVSTSVDNKLNSQVIRLNKKLPKDNSSVIVKFIPKGFQGDRISLYKDIRGFLNFRIIASNNIYAVSTPIYWARNTWHRVQASYQVNSVQGLNELKLFVDGYERNSELLDPNDGYNRFFYPEILPVNLRSNYVPTMKIGTGNKYSNINFKDIINQLYIGSDYNLKKNAYCLIDNLRISNLARPTYAPYGEAIDINYSSNLSVVNPVVEDVYTTYLLNFDSVVTRNEDFSFLVAKNGGYYDFTLNIFDSFGIVNSSDTVRQILEKLIAEFKPANSRAFINYIE